MCPQNFSLSIYNATLTRYYFQNYFYIYLTTGGGPFTSDELFQTSLEVPHVLHRRLAGDVVDKSRFEFLRSGRSRELIVFIAEGNAKRFSENSRTDGFEDCETSRGDVSEELRGEVFVGCFQQTSE